VEWVRSHGSPSGPERRWTSCAAGCGGGAGRAGQLVQWIEGLHCEKKIIGPVFYIILKYPVFHLSCKHSIYFKVSYLNLKLCYYIRAEFYVIFSSTTIVVRGVGKKIRTWVLPNFIGPRCQAATCTIKLTGFPAS
jgi:hypothetical protein